MTCAAALAGFISLFAPQPRVATILTWVDTINTLPTTYTIYRADGTCAALYQMELIVAGVTDKTYIDNTVRANRQYCYTITAVSNGIESIAGDRVTITIPRQGAARRKNATSINVTPRNS